MMWDGHLPGSHLWRRGRFSVLLDRNIGSTAGLSCEVSRVVRAVVRAATVRERLGEMLPDGPGSEESAN